MEGRRKEKKEGKEERREGMEEKYNQDYILDSLFITFIIS